MNNFNEIELGYQVRQALNQSAQHLTLKQQQRLAQARQMALSRQRQTTVAISQLTMATTNNTTAASPKKMGLWATVVASLLILATGIIVLQNLEKSIRLEELADIDTAVLTDELPVSAYLDRGFKVFAQSEMQE